MTKILIVFALALVWALPLAAQEPLLPQPDHTMEALLAARATLIQRYVQSMKIARGVSVCGDTDLLSGEDRSYLVVYVYRDTASAFLSDFVNFLRETKPGESLGVGGIPVQVELIGPASGSCRPATQDSIAVKIKLEIAKKEDKFAVQDENGVIYGPVVKTRKEAEQLLKDWKAYLSE